ncbi:hypothetical protein BDQ17DRAFT_569527 [Cyathus striatus]|nr:hypothetical protein BDQ17DRAFT_569527 [Cyathus striatus]
MHMPNVFVHPPEEDQEEPYCCFDAASPSTPPTTLNDLHIIHPFNSSPSSSSPTRSVLDAYQNIHHAHHDDYHDDWDDHVPTHFDPHPPPLEEDSEVIEVVRVRKSRSTLPQHTFAPPLPPSVPLKRASSFKSKASKAFRSLAGSLRGSKVSQVPQPVHIQTALQYPHYRAVAPPSSPNYSPQTPPPPPPLSNHAPPSLLSTVTPILLLLLQPHLHSPVLLRTPSYRPPPPDAPPSMQRLSPTSWYNFAPPRLLLPPPVVAPFPALIFARCSPFHPPPSPPPAQEEQRLPTPPLLVPRPRPAQIPQILPTKLPLAPVAPLGIAPRLLRPSTPPLTLISQDLLSQLTCLHILVLPIQTSVLKCDSTPFILTTFHLTPINSSFPDLFLHSPISL